MKPPKGTRALVLAVLTLSLMLSVSPMAWAHGGSGGDPGWGWQDAPGYVGPGAPWSGL